jgi:hypothetical protein
VGERRRRHSHQNPRRHLPRLRILLDQKTIYNNYWPGSDATGDVRAYVADDANTQWEVQAGVANTAFGESTIGQTADIVATPTGNTTTGISENLVAVAGRDGRDLRFKTVPGRISWSQTGEILLWKHRSQSSSSMKSPTW